MNFKRFAAAALAAVMFAGAAVTCKLPDPLSVTADAAETLTDGDYEYTVNSDGETVTITKYTGTDSEVEIPGSLGGKNVTTIGAHAFYGCTSLTSVTIPKGVTKIDYRVFEYCSSLTSLTIPNSVTSLGSIYGCRSLTAAVYGGTVEEWRALLNANYENDTDGDPDYMDFRFINQVTCTDGIYKRNSSATFVVDGNLEFKVLEDGTLEVTGFASDDFKETVKELIIPEEVNGKKVTNIGIPEGKKVFYNCSELTSVTIPNGVTTIGARAFDSCAALTSVTIPSSVTKMARYAFTKCESLNTVVYGGTQAEWKAIDVKDESALDSSFYDSLKYADIICTDGIINERDTETSEPTSSGTSEPTSSGTSTPTDGTSTPTDTSDIDEDGVAIGAGVTAILDEKTLEKFGEDFNISASRVVVAAGDTDKDGNLLVSADANVVKDLSKALKKEIAKIKTSDFRIINIDLADGDYVEGTAPAAIKFTVNVPFDAKVYQVNGDSVNKMKSTSRKKTDGSYDVSFSTDCFSPFIFTTADLKNEKPTDKDNNSVDDGSSAADDTGDPTSSDTSTPTTSELPAQDIPTPDSSDFHKENEVIGEVETSPDAAGVPESDRITSITINPAFNMKNKDGDNVELDLSKITIKASEIYDKEGLKRAEEALGETLNGNKKYNLLDLTLLYNGEDFSNGYEGLVKVIIPLPKGHRDKTFSCYRLVEVNGKTVKQLIPGEQTADSYVIYLEHFSLYALVADGDTPGSGNGSTGSSTKPSSTKSSSANSNSTKNPSTGIALAIAPVVLAAGAVAVVALKKKH